jgi:hypothetical protein
MKVSPRFSVSPSVVFIESFPTADTPFTNLPNHQTKARLCLKVCQLLLKQLVPHPTEVTQTFALLQAVFTNQSATQRLWH